MLKKFSVSNFKNFKDKVILDLGDTKNYKFNSECIKNGIINTAIIYGKNASGKSNLLLAIFDIVGSVTDFTKGTELYDLYINRNNLKITPQFEYEFLFDGQIIKYTCEKTNYDKFVFENITVSDKTIVERSAKDKNIFINIPGLENLDTVWSDDSISVIKYIYRNSKLKDLESIEAKSLISMINFIEGMLLYFDLQQRVYIGLTNARGSIYKKIIEENKLKEFQNFLKDFDLNFDLVAIKSNGEDNVGIKFDEQNIVEFSSLASSGMTALAVSYYWLMNLSQIKLLVIDEFDAFYHGTLSQKFVKLLIRAGCQVILTTHNTSIMSNSIMRPDCYFRINNNGLLSLSNAADLEIREAHNLEKIYRSGWFDE